MALKILWTKRAISEYDKIIKYLEENWTEKEIKNFVQQTDNLLNLLKVYPEILQRTNRHINVFRGPINKLTILTYRLKPKKQIIEIINFRSARKKPL